MADKMEFQQVTVSLEYGVWNRIREKGLQTGMTVEEIIKFEMGIMFPEVVQPKVFSMFQAAPGEQLQNPNAFYAKIMAGTGQVKCRKCMKAMTSDEIINGECECGEKL